MHASRLLGSHELPDTAEVGLTLHIGTGALQTIHDEIQAHRPGIEVLEYETGGGIFGPPVHGWRAGVVEAARSELRGDLEAALR